MLSPLLCIAHRGAMGHVPENTLLAIRTALEMGARAIEVDVYMAHGHLVVIHDNPWEQSLDFENLRTFDAGQGEQIPLLDEVVDEIAGHACLNIEIKGKLAVDHVVNLIRTRISHPDAVWKQKQFLISSFDHRILQRVRELDHRIPIAALGYAMPVDDARYGELLGALAVNPSLEWVDRRFVEDAHTRGLQVFVYTVNTPAALERMYEMGVDGVFTNYPERVLEHYPQPDMSQGWPVYRA